MSSTPSPPPLPPPAARPRPAQASPWPFVGMGGLAAAFFLFGASALVAPMWAVAALLGVWVVMFVLACRWWTPHPKRLVVLAVVAVVFWFAVVSAGAVFLDWSA